MKKLGIVPLLLVLVSCAATSEKTQSEYFKDFQTQLLGLSQRIEVLEAKTRKDTSLRGDVYGRVDKLEEQLTQIEASLNKVKTHPLFEGLDTVKLTPAPSSTVINIRPESVPKTVEAPAKQETQKEEVKPAKEEVKGKEFQVVGTIGQKEKVAAVYNQGYDMYVSGKYAQAISIFRDFIQNHSSDALADNAQYWIAECYYAQKMFEKAISEFKKVENYHDKNKAPDAYLKVSYAYAELGKKEESAKWKKLLLEKFKDSEAAKKAQEKTSH